MADLPTNQELDRMLEKIKKEVFLDSNAAFLGSLLCSHEFQWAREGPLANIVGTDGIKIVWGINDFLGCTPKERASTLLHEIWHTGKLHHLRRGDRDRLIWNVACDYRINNDLRTDNYVIPDTWVVDPSLDSYGIMAEEQIYDLLIQNALPMPQTPTPDLREPEQQNNVIATVVRAMQAAKMAGQAGALPGGIEETLNAFLEPVIPWRNVLMQWATDLSDNVEFTWKRPNRRFQDIYLPSKEAGEGRLAHLVYFIDVSGSITKQEIVRVNSEVKYIWEVLQPEKLTLVQFDTRITKVTEFNEGDEFDRIEIVGRGGTSFYPVREWIEEHKPTAAIIYSDMECAPMKPLTQPIPIIWAVVRNKDIQVDFGKVIYITE